MHKEQIFSAYMQSNKQKAKLIRQILLDHLRGFFPAVTNGGLVSLL